MIVENFRGGAAPDPTKPAAQKKSSWFGGGGNTLGSDEAPSVAVPDPNARPAGSSRKPPGGARGLLASLGLGGGQAEDDEDLEQTQIRHLTFWRDGFSVADGPLLRYDVPENQQLLEAIKSG